MGILTNKLSLKTYANNKEVFIPLGSKIEFLEIKKSYHPYYEIHTYSLDCKFENLIVEISCSKYVDGNQPKVDCVDGNLFKNKTYFWSEVFDEEFPG